MTGNVERTTQQLPQVAFDVLVLGEADQAFNAGDGRFRIALQQMVDHAQFGLGVAGLDLRDAQRDGVGLLAFAGLLVDGRHRLQRRHEVRHRLQPALDHGARTLFGERFEQQARMPQVGGLRVLGQRGVERVAGFALRRRDGARLRTARPRCVVRAVARRRPGAARQGALVAAGGQLHLADHRVHGRRGAGAFEQRRQLIGGLGRMRPWRRMQIGHQRAQRARARVGLEHAAERLFGESQVALGQIGETERVAQLQVVRRAFGGPAQDGQGVVGVAATQRKRAFDAPPRAGGRGRCARRCGPCVRPRRGRRGPARAGPA